MARTRVLAVGLAALVALVAARSTPAFYVPPPAPGQQVGAWFPHPVNLAPLTLERDSAGRLVVGGSATFVPASSVATLARFTASGAPDTAFGNGGVVLDEAAGEASLVTPLSDGRSLIATRGGKDVVIERRLADGSPDPAFSAFVWHSTNPGGVAVPLALTP